mgnify:CR=1 FL=1
MALHVFDGLCVDGPLGEKRLTHTAPVFCVPLMEAQAVDAGADTAAELEFSFGEYRHFGRRWWWKMPSDRAQPKR